MESIISLPKTTYERLLRKAQLAERMRLLIQKEYPKKGYLESKVKKLREFVPTPAQKRELARAREDYKKGNYLTFNELKQKLGVKS